MLSTSTSSKIPSTLFQQKFLKYSENKNQCISSLNTFTESIQNKIVQIEGKMLTFFRDYFEDLQNATMSYIKEQQPKNENSFDTLIDNEKYNLFTNFFIQSLQMIEDQAQKLADVVRPQNYEDLDSVIKNFTSAKFDKFMFESGSEKFNQSPQPDSVLKRRNKSAMNSSPLHSPTEVKKSIASQPAGVKQDDPEVTRTELIQDWQKRCRPKEKKATIKVDEDLKHPDLEVNQAGNSVRGKSGNFVQKISFMKPSVEVPPAKEVHFQFIIKHVKNLKYGCPMAIGLAHRNIVETHCFSFSDEENKRNSPMKSAQSTYTSLQDQIIQKNNNNVSQVMSRHGCYLLTCDGHIRNHTDLSQDMKKVGIRFNTGDVISCHFNPFRNYLRFSKKILKDKEINFTVNIQLVPGDRLFPCVRLQDPSDEVAIKFY